MSIARLRLDTVDLDGLVKVPRTSITMHVDVETEPQPRSFIFTGGR